MKQIAVNLIEEAVDAGARRHQACDILGISCRTLLRWQAAGDDLADKRRQTNNRHYTHALTQEEKHHILALCNQPEYQSLPPSQIVPKLADKGIYIASESSFYRVLRTHGQLNRRGRAQPPRQVPKPMSWVATAPNQVWSWDITYLPSAVRGQFYRLYMTMDIYSRLITGWEIHLEESAQHAATLINKACLKHGIRKDQLILHSDNGSPMKGATMLATLQRLGIMPSFSRPSVSDDNPYSESLFRALKYTPAYPNKPFTSLEQARQWVHQFVIWYNTQHCHSGIQFVTPEQRHSGQDNAILAHRRVVYETAKEARPERWKNRSVRNWKPVKEVWLNPSKESNELERNVVLAA